MTTDAVSGIWNYSLELARALRPRGMEVCLACMGPAPTPRQRQEAAAVGNIEFHEKPFSLEWMPEPWTDIARAGEWLLGLEDAFEANVVHLNHYSHATLPWSSPVLLTAHGDRISWWRAVHGCDAPPKLSRYRTEICAGLRSADLLVAPTRASLDALDDLRGQNPNRPEFSPRVIPHARSSALFPARSKRDFILAAGRAWDGAKNMAPLEAAASGLAWPVFMAGSTEDLQGNSVEFRHVDCLGPLASGDLANWMGLASIFVVPSRYEPCGLSAIEAALAGCALILSDIPSLRETWCDTAFFFPPDDPKALSATIRRLIKDTPLRNQFGSQARRRALERTPDQMGESYLECYRDLLTRTSHSLELGPGSR
jgi:glycogen(starch) synthase